MCGLPGLGCPLHRSAPLPRCRVAPWVRASLLGCYAAVDRFWRLVLRAGQCCFAAPPPGCPDPRRCAGMMVCRCFRDVVPDASGANKTAGTPVNRFGLRSTCEQQGHVSHCASALRRAYLCSGTRAIERIDPSSPKSCETRRRWERLHYFAAPTAVGTRRQRARARADSAVVGARTARQSHANSASRRQHPTHRKVTSRRRDVAQ